MRCRMGIEMTEKSFLQIKAYNELKNRILTGEFQPDTLYSETKISSEISISRTPMREALQRLSQDGYISIVPSKGFMIRTLTEKDMLESTQVRCAIEGYCASILASDSDSRKKKTALSDLRKCIDQMEQSLYIQDEHTEFIRHDHEFHMLLVNYAGNEEFNEIFQRLLYMIQLTSKNALSAEGRPEGTLKEHKALLSLLESGDAGAAYKAIIEHLMMPLRIYKK